MRWLHYFMADARLRNAGPRKMAPARDKYNYIALLPTLRYTANVRHDKIAELSRHSTAILANRNTLVPVSYAAAIYALHTRGTAFIRRSAVDRNNKNADRITIQIRSCTVRDKTLYYQVNL